MEERVLDNRQYPSWREAYEMFLLELSSNVTNSRITICGNSVCVDARADLRKMTNLLAATESGPAGLAKTLLGRAAKGVGGEIRFTWSEGPEWLNKHETFEYTLGGTGAQASWALTTVGASALLALQDRSAHMLKVVPGAVLIAENGKAVAASSIQPSTVQRPYNYIVEFTKGQSIGDVVPPRSSRVISRFYDFGIEHDVEFERLSRSIAPSAGAALVSGFNCVIADDLDTEIEYVFSLCRDWIRNGLKVVHLELAGYDGAHLRDRVLASSRGSISSLGMSQSEFIELVGAGENMPVAMQVLAERLELRRICVHADEWALALTLDNPDQEQKALMMGCLLASSRARAGRPVKPVEIPAEAEFAEPPFASLHQLDKWNVVSCSSPYLAQPASALGAGDTFTAGCLLVLGQDLSLTRTSPRPSPVAAGAYTSNRK